MYKLQRQGSWVSGGWDHQPHNRNGKLLLFPCYFIVYKLLLVVHVKCLIRLSRLRVSRQSSRWLAAENDARVALWPLCVVLWVNKKSAQRNLPCSNIKNGLYFYSMSAFAHLHRDDYCAGCHQLIRRCYISTQWYAEDAALRALLRLNTLQDVDRRNRGLNKRPFSIICNTWATQYSTVQCICLYKNLVL